MAQVTKRVSDPLLIGRYAEFKSVKATLPEQPRLCSKHHEAVTSLDAYSKSQPPMVD